MLTLTPAVRTLVAGAELDDETGGLRISAGDPAEQGEGLDVALMDGPAATDDEIAAGGAHVFLEPTVAELLADRVLDATVESGRVRFMVFDRSNPRAPQGRPSAIVTRHRRRLAARRVMHSTIWIVAARRPESIRSARTLVPAGTRSPGRACIRCRGPAWAVVAPGPAVPDGREQLERDRASDRRPRDRADETVHTGDDDRRPKRKCERPHEERGRRRSAVGGLRPRSDAAG